MSKETSTATPLVTHREFKLLLKPEKFPTRRALLEFNELLESSAKKLGVRYESVESIDSQLRIVQFMIRRTKSFGVTSSFFGFGKSARADGRTKAGS